MMHKCLAIITTTVLLTGGSPASASNYRMQPYWTYGNTLFRACEGGAGSFRDGVCVGFVFGVVDMHNAAGLKMFCVPEGVTGGQLKDIAKKYLAEHPGERHLPASFLVIKALKETFPCWDE